MLFRFVGSDSEIGHIRVHEFGTLLDLDAQTAHDAVLSRVGLVTDVDFQTTNITDEELTQFSDSHNHVDAPDSFRQKVAKVHKMAASMHYDYLAAAAAGDTFMTRAAKSVQKPAPVVTPIPTLAPRMDPPIMQAPKES